MACLPSRAPRLCVPGLELSCAWRACLWWCCAVPRCLLCSHACVCACVRGEIRESAARCLLRRALWVRYHMGMLIRSLTGEASAMQFFTVTFYAGPTVDVQAESADEAFTLAQSILPTTATGVVRDADGNLA